MFPLGIKYVLIISLGVAATGFLASDMAIKALFGEQYTHSIIALQILLCGITFVFALTYFQMMLIAIHQQKKVLKVAVVGLGFNVLLNLFLIPRYGYVGASLATIFCELLVFILLYLYLNTTEVKMPIHSTFGKPLFAMALPLAMLYAIPYELNLFLKIALINIFFIALLFTFKVMSLQDFKFISMEEQLIR